MLADLQFSDKLIIYRCIHTYTYTYTHHAFTHLIDHTHKLYIAYIFGAFCFTFIIDFLFALQICAKYVTRKHYFVGWGLANKHVQVIKTGVPYLVVYDRLSTL